MKNTLINTTRATILAVAVGIAAGCATVSREEFDAVQSTSNNALSEARAAREAANNAQGMASQAASDAREARVAAESAQTAANETSEKLDRMFQRSMRK